MVFKGAAVRARGFRRACRAGVSVQLRSRHHKYAEGCISVCLANQTLILLSRDHHCLASIQTFGQVEIGAAIIFPSILIRNTDMPTFHIRVTELDIVLKTLPHVKLDVQLCRVGVNAVACLDEIIPTTRSVEVIVIRRNQIVVLTSLRERHRQPHRKSVFCHRTVRKLDTIQTVEIIFLGLPIPFHNIPVAHIPRYVTELEPRVWRPFCVRKINR